MTVSSPIEVGQEFEALVVFTDYARFTAISKKRGLGATANFLEQSAEITFDVVSAAGGTVVKYIGDASLIVFGAEQVDAGVAALIDLVATIGIDSRLNASAHFGLVRGVSLRGIEMPDVLGQAVNIAASLEREAGRRGGVALSPQAFRKLGPQMRKRFHRFRPPEFYLAN